MTYSQTMYVLITHEFCENLPPGDLHPNGRKTQRILKLMKGSKLQM